MAIVIISRGDCSFYVIRYILFCDVTVGVSHISGQWEFKKVAIVRHANIEQDQSKIQRED